MSRTRQPEKDSIYVGLRILEYLVAGRSSRGVSQIAHALDAPVSSTHDMLKLMGQLGLVSQQSDTHRYEVTLDLFRLINRFAKEFGIIPLVRDSIQQFVDQLKCTLYLCRWWRGETYVVYAQGPLASTASLGGHHSAHLSAAAKCLLARRDPSIWQDYAPAFNGDKFINELTTARQEGVAWNIRQTDPNICSVAIPLGDREDLDEYAIAFVLRPAEFERREASQILENLFQIRDEMVHQIPPL